MQRVGKTRVQCIERETKQLHCKTAVIDQQFVCLMRRQRSSPLALKALDTFYAAAVVPGSVLMPTSIASVVSGLRKEALRVSCGGVSHGKNTYRMPTLIP